MTSDTLTDRIVRFYALSDDANGLPVATILSKEFSIENLQELLTPLVNGGQVEVVFEEVDQNPHIQRLPRRMKRSYSELICICDLSSACLFPSPSLIEARNLFNDKIDEPYTYLLWRGGSQLDVHFFELEVLEMYRNNPKYKFDFNYFDGSLTISNFYYDSASDKEKNFLQRFGVGYDSEGLRVVGVILRDLADLSPQHQRIWREHERMDSCTLNLSSIDAWMFGRWSEFSSIYEAILEELRIINEMTTTAFNKSLFLNEFQEGPPANFGVLLRPTEKEFLDFARTLDLFLADNINRDFFPEWLERSRTTRSKGEERIEHKGTLSMLEEWIQSSFQVAPGLNPAKEICDPWKELRKLRSKASHTSIQDVFDHRYEKKQNDLVESCYKGLRTLRMLITNHPSARKIEVPEWLYKGLIKTP